MMDQKNSILFKRGRVVLCALAAALVFCAFPAEGLAKSRPEYITVGLKYGSAAVGELVLKSKTGFQIVNMEEDGPENTLPLPAYTELTAQVENGIIVLRDEDGTMLVSDLGTTGAVMPMDYEDGGGVITFDGAEYRDGIQLTRNSGSTMNVINYIELDHYLYGVIHAEMSQSFPLEALKAQAVVARSYARLNQHAHRDYGFDVCATTHCQVYKGVSGEYPKTTQAVDETSGEVIYSDGKVVQVYFFKNSGGHTQNSEDVWSSAEPYLRGVKDPYSPAYPWEATMTFDEIKTKLEAASYHPGTIKSVAITGRNDAGAVSELTIKGSSDTVVLKKEAVRTALGAPQIKSTMFDLANGNGETGSGGASHGDEGSVYVTDGSSTKERDGSFYAVSSSGSVKKISAGDVMITDGSKTVKPGSGSSGNSSGGNSSSQALSTVTGGKVVFSGKGYGHGIGMPQDGAIKMAQEGFDYEEILEFYFTDIEIR